MLHYYRFNADLPHPVPARATYWKHEPGKGWPDQCPPIRAANAYGWDVINPFDMHFLRDEEGHWSLEDAVEVLSDIDLDEGMTPHPQLNAWFWDPDQTRPHEISKNVYPHIRHQVKVSTFLYLRTDPDEMLAVRGIPNLDRDWGIMEALVETDWYAPAHPMHTVVLLPRIEDSDIDEVLIGAGEPLCRLVPLVRSEFVAREMDGAEFGEMFAEGQQWLMAHGRCPVGDDVDITGAYVSQQVGATFEVEADTGDRTDEDPALGQ